MLQLLLETCQEFQLLFTVFLVFTCLFVNVIVTVNLLLVTVIVVVTCLLITVILTVILLIGTFIFVVTCLLVTVIFVVTFVVNFIKKDANQRYHECS